MIDEELTDEELVKALRDTYDLVKMWPEKQPDGFTNLLVLRNLVPDAADRIEAVTEQLEAARADAKEAEAYVEEVEKDREELRKRANEKIISLEKGCAAQAAQIEAMRGELATMLRMYGDAQAILKGVGVEITDAPLSARAALTTENQTNG